jgi:hypothetical protein
MPTMKNIILSAARSQTHWSGYNMRNENIP